MNPKKRICVSCNEDGFGPSAFAYYLVRAIVQEWTEKRQKTASDLKIVVLNNHAHDFTNRLTQISPTLYSLFL